MTTVYRKYELTDDLWARIELANKSIETMTLERTNKKTGEIVRNSYAQVNQRVKAFRYVYPRGRIETKIISLDGEVGHRQCLMRCEIYDDLGNLLSVGYAEEKEDSSFINQTSFIENCETSAVGRALGLAGFGIDVSIASFEEVSNAINNQETKKPTFRKQSMFEVLYTQEEQQQIRDHYNVEKNGDLPREIVEKYVKDRKEKYKEMKQNSVDEALIKPNLESETPFY